LGSSLPLRSAIKVLNRAAAATFGAAGHGLVQRAAS
jgi:hypothetical protein